MGLLMITSSVYLGAPPPKDVQRASAKVPWSHRGPGCPSTHKIPHEGLGTHKFWCQGHASCMALTALGTHSWGPSRHSCFQLHNSILFLTLLCASSKVEGRGPLSKMMPNPSPTSPIKQPFVPMMLTAVWQTDVHSTVYITQQVL